MRADALARLRLSLVVEAGDPRLRDALTRLRPEQVVERLTAGDDPSWPEEWRRAAMELPRLEERANALAERAEMTWVTPGDHQWPRQLADLDAVADRAGSAGAPLGLWARGGGRLGELVEASVAVVGARQCTTYGAECAGEIAADCADAGLTVVSGAAFGIDACAHRGALLTPTPTVAVLACGADLDYPRAHAALLHRIAESGLVVSEQAPGEPARKHRFLSRNRLIAALSAGTVVVEAARRSGSLNTLHWADQLSRTTMVVPGPVTSQLSGGCHAAARAGEAVLVTCATEVIEEMYAIAPNSPAGGMPVSARRVWQVLGPRPTALGELAAAGRMGTRDALRGLNLLCAAGLAEHTDERLWRRTT